MSIIEEFMKSRPCDPKTEIKEKTQTNNERFNEVLNSCAHSRQVCAALMLLAEPSVQQSDDMLQKRKIFIRDLFTWLDISQSNKKVI